MTHRRLAANAVAEGADIDSLAYVDEYRCDGCQGVFAAGELTRLQGQAFAYGAATGYINADLCKRCLDHQPVSVIVHGLDR